jgi:hypothetical protein
MPGLVPGIHAFLFVAKQDVDGRDKPGHDVARYDSWLGITPAAS